MALITEELVRRRAEHNEKLIGSLEEISLHQQDIIKIENIQNWCRELQVLLLQSNLISRIENLGKLKKLKYLNLAINNIERIENLENCESLQKLDLTLNFIGELTSINTLVKNSNLIELYLTGNPCWKFDCYRDYVIATLPQLEYLDGILISPANKITAKQAYHDVQYEVNIQQTEYQEKRRLEKRMINSKQFENEEMDEKKPLEFWQQISENTPETRLAMAEHVRKLNKEKVVDLSHPTVERKVKLFKSDGCPLNVNEARIPFTMKEDAANNIVLTVDIYKHLDTSMLDVDVQPWFVRVLVKKKVLQLVLSDEVHPDKSTAQRAITSRRLVITMPKFQNNTT